MDELTHEIVAENPPVVMYTAPNAGPKTLSGTHPYLVGSGTAYIIDPGPDLPQYLEALAAVISRRSSGPYIILLTHAHPDHAPGAAPLARLLDAPIYASASMPEETRRRLGVTATFSPNAIFPLKTDTLQAIASPGHTADHVAFWLQRSRILFAGDVILGQGTTVIAPPEGNMQAYMQTLDLFRSLHPSLIAPGHGPLVRDPAGKVDEYIEHRRARERQVLDALSHGPATIDRLVQQIYADVDPTLHQLASLSLQAQLEKLEAEGRVTRDGKTYVLRPAARQDLADGT